MPSISSNSRRDGAVDAFKRAGRLEPRTMVDLTSLTLWTAIATWGLATGTIVLLYWQTRQNARLNSANAVIGLRERFDSPRMRRARRQLAEEWSQDRITDLASIEVLTFFELVGAQTQRGILDHYMVWEAFGGWVTSYYWAMRHPRDRFGQFRDATHDPLAFFRLEWLNDRMLEIDQSELGTDHIAASEVEAYFQQFLARESKIDVD